MIQLRDYVADKTKMRLDILIGPAVVNRKQLVLMIEDWIKDPSRQRLKLIENILFNVSPSAVKVKPKLSAILSGPSDDFLERRNSLSQRIQTMKQGWTGRNYDKLPESERTLFESLKSELNDLELSYGYINNRSSYTPDEIAQGTSESQISILKAMFGDWTNERSTAYKLINGHISKISIVSHINPTILLTWLDKYAETNVYGGYIVNNLAARGKNGKGGGTLYEIISKSSGIQPSNAFQMTNEKGSDVTGALGTMLPSMNQSII
jgi:hypothetical protein